MRPRSRHNTTNFVGTENPTQKPSRQRKKKGYLQGIYTPKHPEKYAGNVDNIIYRSSWELHVNQFLDNNVNVLRWASEEIKIPYIKPTDRKVHNYFPDFWVQYRNTSGMIVQEIWEVKPLKQSKQQSRVGKSKKQQISESVTLSINKAKWDAARKFCQKYHMEFKVMTELSIFK